MATREELVARRDAINTELDAAVIRVSAGDRTTQFDIPAKERARDRLNNEIAQLDACGRGPMARQIRVSSSRGY